MPLPTQTLDHSGRASRTPVSKWGAAARFDFDNPQKWVTDKSVPILDEHEATDENGNPIEHVDKAFLEEIARNNNRRVFETGDPATLILGHTSDDPRAPEKPAKGFAVNYHVKPFRKDPTTGELIYAIHCDRKFRPNNAHLIEEYPRTSVELWMHKKEIDPIAMLGGTTPERDLGARIRHARIVAVLEPRGDGQRRSSVSDGISGDFDGVIRYSTRGNWTIFRYSMPEGCSMASRNEGAGYRSMGKKRYEDNGVPDPELTGAESDGDLPPGDGMGGDDGAEDPTVARVLSSKPFRELSDMVHEMYDAIMGEAGGAGGEMDGTPGGGEMPGDDGMGEGAPGDMNGTPVDEEERDMHGEQPVRFRDMPSGDDDDADFMGDEHRDYAAPTTGFAGPTSTHIPGVVGGRRYSRNGDDMNGELVRMQRRLDNVERENKQLRQIANGSALKLARSNAANLVESLKKEGIVFGDTAQEAAAEEKRHVELFEVLDDQSLAFQTSMIRKHYKRKAADPASPRTPGMAFFARNPEGTPGESDEDFDPADMNQAREFAALQVGPHKMSLADASKKMAKKYGRQNRERRTA